MNHNCKYVKANILSMTRLEESCTIFVEIIIKVIKLC